MQPSNDNEKRLLQVPLPRLHDGPHRETLKQSLLDLHKETIMKEMASNPMPAAEAKPAPKRRRFVFGLVAGATVVAGLLMVYIGWPKLQGEPRMVRQASIDDTVERKRINAVRSLIRPPFPDGANEPPVFGVMRADFEPSNKGKHDESNSPPPPPQFAGGSKDGRELGRGALGGGALGGVLGGAGGGPRANEPIPPNFVSKRDPEAVRRLDISQRLYAAKAISEQDYLDQVRAITGGDAYAPLADNPFHKPSQSPLSTFSVDVDTASYTNVRRYLMQERQFPPKNAVRIEEMINYFVYDDPRPDDGKPVAIKTEVGPCPWNAAHQLVRIGLRAKSVSPEQSPPRNLVFLIDTSGSMSATDRLPLLKKGLHLLVGTLRPQDRVAIVAYAGNAGLVLASTSGAEKQAIFKAIDRLDAGGSTNGGEGIVLAYKIAQESFIKDGVNRVILGTDGDFNVGVTTQGDLVRLIEEQRKSGILLSILGFGHGNLKDATMEKLAHHGNGHYSYIDTLEEAHRIFVEQGAALEVVAYDVKVQIEFNPARVASYRLVGYENRLMRHQDFNDDQKDAGDMGSGHTVTALYEIVPTGKDTEPPALDPLRYQQKPAQTPAPTGGPLTDAALSNELMLVKVRYKDPGAETSKLLSQPVVDIRRPLAETSADFRFAAAVAEFALLLRDSSHKGTANLANIIAQSRSALALDPHGHRAAFVQMAETALRLKQ